MVRCRYFLYNKPYDDSCQNEAIWLACDGDDCVVCDKHKCRCKIRIVECACKGDFKHCPMCKGEGWALVR